MPDFCLALKLSDDQFQRRGLYPNITMPVNKIISNYEDNIR